MLVVGQEILLDFINNDRSHPYRDVHENDHHSEGRANARGSVCGLDAAGVRYHDRGVDHEREECDGEVHVRWPGAGVECPSCPRQVAGSCLQASIVISRAEEFVEGEGERDERSYREEETEAAGVEAEASDALLEALVMVNTGRT